MPNGQRMKDAQDVGGRVAQAGVDVAELRQREEVGGVLGVLEVERS